MLWVLSKRVMCALKTVVTSESQMCIRRRGVTFVELLVTMGIIVLLTALILPAIQKVRESAYRIQCRNNLKQLGLAAQAFHADFDRLPPGYLGPDPSQNANIPSHLSSGQWIGHLPLLLPYLEQDSLFAKLQVNWNLR